MQADHLKAFIERIPHGGQTVTDGVPRRSPKDTPLHKPERDEDCLRCQAEQAWNADGGEPMLFSRSAVEVR